MIITASLRANLSELDALAVVKQFKFAEKLDWLPKRFGFPKFTTERRSAIQQLVDRRNEYVHYKWKGVTQQELETADRQLQETVAGAGALLDYLETFEHEQLAQEGVTAAIELFKVQRKDLSGRSFRRTA